MGRKKIFKISDKNKQIIDQYIEMRTCQRKSSQTIKNERITLTKLADLLKNKSFKNATEIDIQLFFKNINSSTAYNHYGNQVIAFYRWLFKLDRKARPNIMKWFSHKSLEDIEREKDADIKSFIITPDDYQKILDICKDRFGMWEALWEVYYLSGARRSEIRNMKTGDVIIHDDGKVSLKLRKSKTKPRTVPLPEIPNRLIRWLNNHIFNVNPRLSAKEFIQQEPDKDMWISLSNIRYGKLINSDSLSAEFIKIKNKAGLKKNLTIHCFRKTRATIMFSARSKDGGLIYDDKMMSQYFGWKITTVAQRRQEYDLRDYEDLQKQIFNSVKDSALDYDSLKQQKELLEQKHQREINELKKQLKKKTEIDNFIIDSLSLIAKEMVQNQGVESIKEVFRKYNVPLIEE